MNCKLDGLVVDFLECFETVFSHDWDFIKSVIGDDCLISPDGDFVNPKIGDESNNWFNRGSLLAAYRALRVAVMENQKDNVSKILICQHCGHEYTRHTKVECFDRYLEDSVVGIHTVVNNGRINQDNNVSSSPSPRRDGISIFYRCESCGLESRVDIYQHKGQTFLR